MAVPLKVHHRAFGCIDRKLSEVDAEAVFPGRCPDLGLDELKTAEYDADRLWTARSIAITRLTIVALWLGCFTALSILIGTFVHQMADPISRRTARDSKTIVG